MAVLRAALSVIACLTASASSAEVSEFTCLFNSVCTVKKGCVDATFELGFIVDLEDRRAFARGNRGSANVLAHSRDGAVSFIEPVASGVVQTTSISFTTGEAVHSRRTLIEGNFVASQYLGTCGLR